MTALLLGQARQQTIHAQRQIIRWLAHDYRQADERLTTALAQALAAEDWELRASAMLAAARLRATSLAVAVRRVELPNTGREGLTEADRKLLVAMRKAAALLLAGTPVPNEPPEAPATREEWQAHLLRCVAGAPVKVYDRIFLLSHALTQPLPDAPLPPRLPPGVLATGTGYRLARSGLAMVWVPPIGHWLGDEVPASSLPAPIRPVMPVAGYFVAARPLTRSEVQPIAPQVALRPVAQNDRGYAGCSLAEADRIVTALRALEGVSARLPTADEWEMAARGPDSRRYPWGNGLEPGMLNLPSPWGCYETVGLVGQWTCSTTGSGEPIVCGVPPTRGCAARFSARPDDPHSIRPVILLD